MAADISASVEGPGTSRAGVGSEAPIVAGTLTPGEAGGAARFRPASASRFPGGLSGLAKAAELS